MMLSAAVSQIDELERYIERIEAMNDTLLKALTKVDNYELG
jgi:hypothetical protein